MCNVPLKTYYVIYAQLELIFSSTQVLKLAGS